MILCNSLNRTEIPIFLASSIVSRRFIVGSENQSKKSSLNTENREVHPGLNIESSDKIFTEILNNLFPISQLQLKNVARS